MPQRTEALDLLPRCAAPHSCPHALRPACSERAQTWLRCVRRHGSSARLLEEALIHGHSTQSSLDGRLASAYIGSYASWLCSAGARARGRTERKQKHASARACPNPAALRSRAAGSIWESGPLPWFSVLRCAVVALTSDKFERGQHNCAHMYLPA